MKTLLLLCLIISIACSKSDSKKSNTNQDSNIQTIDYAQADEDFHLVEDAFGFRTDGINFVRMNISLSQGFDDYKVIYDQLAGEGYIAITSALNGGSSENLVIEHDYESKVVTLGPGAYSQSYCSISITNRTITSLDGKCALKVRVHLSKNDKIEVFNNGNLKSKRFFGMSNSDFKTFFNSQRWDEDRIKALAEYITSFSSVGTKLNLEGEVLEFVLRKMSYPSEKLKAFRILHRYMNNRVELKNIVDSVFSYFDRKEAYRIASLGEVD